MLVSRVDGERVLPENVEVPARVLDLLDLSVKFTGSMKHSKCFKRPLFGNLDNSCLY